jgi:hypothetical protein
VQLDGIANTEKRTILVSDLIDFEASKNTPFISTSFHRKEIYKQSRVSPDLMISHQIDGAWGGVVVKVLCY